jgi:hypothetical protein
MQQMEDIQYGSILETLELKKIMIQILNYLKQNFYLNFKKTRLKIHGRLLPS